MSLQVFYHLARVRFVGNRPGSTLRAFLQKARPDPRAAEEGVYRPCQPYAFLPVCGRIFRHSRVPAVPVVHVGQWSRGIRPGSPYHSRMEKARVNIKGVLRE